ncbi:uncharacterized protein LOC116131595 [Pistacia vera]|uniref:uncharacterized protein LOC116131595 n=1 Tax=Pistacia vera TaxID=55513 RepID=UPI001262FA93|nr:uncharacterized protein LOC116131595 [Pistacia vera]
MKLMRFSATISGTVSSKPVKNNCSEPDHCDNSEDHRQEAQELIPSLDWLHVSDETNPQVQEIPSLHNSEQVEEGNGSWTCEEDSWQIVNIPSSSINEEYKPHLKRG